MTARKIILATMLAPLCMLPAGLLAQGKYGATPEDSVKCVQCLSLYQEFVKQKNYEDALGPWRCAMTTCPASSKNMYIDGAKIRRYFLDKEKDPSKKVLLADSLYMVYDQRIDVFGQRGYVLGRKAIEMLKYTPERSERIFEHLQGSVEERQAKSEAGVLAAYYQALYNLYQEGKATKDQMLEEYLKVSDYIEQNLAAASSSEGSEEGDTGGSLYERARENVNELFFRVAECADIGAIAEKLLKQRPDDLELKRRLLKVLNTKDCTDQAVYQSLAEDMYKADPSSESAYSLGLYLAKKGDLAGSLKYMQDAVEQCTDCQDKVKYLLRAGQIAGAAGNYSLARSYANKVLGVESKNGEALLLVARSVLAASSGCSEPEAWGPVWLAYDYYQRAKSLDPSVADKANEGMASCAARFPEQSKAFFHQLTEGQSYQVTCGGYNETTTVRVRK
ncbi:MAG: hypothetical protein H6597_02550 [Flavobacteriales bacterium]|nr:hypothetical protein [Flavobacteriales bacterium]MCB9193387.1 hypothetical protein [Flavobacteriales bacterium]